MKILGIIPARGGSKGIPKKNIKKVQGKPLIAYTLELGTKCSDIMDVIVSTDDDEIESIALNYGVSVDKRPKELATDVSDVTDTVFYILENARNDYDLIILLQPTAPLRTKADIFNIIKMFKDDRGLESVVSVVKVEDNHPARMYKLENKMDLLPFDINLETSRRQDLNPLYIRNGCVYAIKTNALKKYKSLMPPNKKAYLMDQRWSVNIDTEIDLELLEIILPKWQAIHENFNH